MNNTSLRFCACPKNRGQGEFVSLSTYYRHAAFRDSKDPTAEFSIEFNNFIINSNADSGPSTDDEAYEAPVFSPELQQFLATAHPLSSDGSDDSDARYRKRQRVDHVPDFLMDILYNGLEKSPPRSSQEIS